MFLRIRPVRRGEEAPVTAFVRRVFDATVARDFDAAGLAEFYRYASAPALAERLASGQPVWVAESPEREIVGAVEIRDSKHIALLFVDPALHGRGVGQRLLRRALAHCRNAVPPVAEVTVHSAVGAVGFYQAMGFAAAGPEQTSNGIRYVPMVARLR